MEYVPVGSTQTVIPSVEVGQTTNSVWNLIGPSVPLFPVEIVGVETICYEEFPISIPQCAPRERHVNTGERHDHVEYCVLAEVFFSKSLHLWRHPRSFHRSASSNLFV